MILSAQTIRAYCEAGGMVEPFLERTVHPETGMSYGLASCTYDVRIAEALLLNPGDFALASTVEKFHMPLDVCATVHDKSSLVRLGLAVQNSFIDPNWCGYLTLELTNHGPEPLHFMPGQPIAQVLFQRLDHATIQPYNGKYQNQPAGPQPARREGLVVSSDADGFFDPGEVEAGQAMDEMES